MADAISELITAAVEAGIQKALRQHARRLLDADEAAEYLGISKTTVKELAARGELPETRITRCVRFSRCAGARLIH